MNKITLIAILIVVVLVLTNIFLFIQVKKANSHLNDLQQNQSLLLGDSLNRKLELTKEEFRNNLKPMLDSIEAIKGIKANRITNVTTINNSYFDSTTIINEAPKVADSIYDISFKEPCWGFNGTFNIGTKERLIFNRYANDTITKFTYFERKELFGVKWFPKWGERRYYIGSYSKCNGVTEVQEYDMKLKK